jgi:hypothetical protein
MERYDSDPPSTITLRPSDLFEAVCVALLSNEFVQITGKFEDTGNGRCAWGVIQTVCQRAGLDYLRDVHPQFFAIERRAGQLLRCEGIAGANDALLPFAQIAAALCQARSEIEASAS